ncbi:MAG: ABC transporter ATP-binding protein [Solirubrobacterales bacterium]|nr:ABC transporter ATP-binding protein [Solirubrobacterales bacterium]
MASFGIRLEEVRKSFPTGDGEGVTAVDGVSMAVGPGSMVALSGPSGSGKSTLLHLIGAMDRADAGRIEVGDTVVTALSRRQQAAFRRTIGFVFQRFHLLAALSVIDNVVAPAMPFKTAFDKYARARELIAAVGLSDRAASLPSRLSGGQQQRVAIARALIYRPGLLLADEPTGNLDSATGAQLLRLLTDLRDRDGMSMLIATHDPVVASRCDRIVTLTDGSITEDVTVPCSVDPAETMTRLTRLDSRE